MIIYSSSVNSVNHLLKLHLNGMSFCPLLSSQDPIPGGIWTCMDCHKDVHPNRTPDWILLCNHTPRKCRTLLFSKIPRFSVHTSTGLSCRKCDRSSRTPVCISLSNCTLAALLGRISSCTGHRAVWTKTDRTAADIWMHKDFHSLRNLNRILAEVQVYKCSRRICHFWLSSSICFSSVHNSTYTHFHSFDRLNRTHICMCLCICMVSCRTYPRELASNRIHLVLDRRLHKTAHIHCGKFYHSNRKLVRPASVECSHRNRKIVHPHLSKSWLSK